jgi:uncharacterized membrane protein YkvA (DUF1232 family)
LNKFVKQATIARDDHDETRRHSMATDLETRCLNFFPDWLQTLGADAADVSKILASPSASLSVKKYAAGALNYLFKSLDLIPDGVEDLGFLDDAFVLRIAASLIVAESQEMRNEAPILTRLAGDKALIVELLGKDYSRLERYVRELTRGAARGRTVDEIVEDDAVRHAFVNEVASWAKEYVAPAFARDEKNVIKLQSFLSAKLPT